MSWAGGSFGSRAACVLAPNASMMTLDGTNTWVLREPDARRSIVVDPGPSVLAHLDAVADAAGEVGVVLLTHHHADHSEAAREFAERMGCGVRALDPAYRLGAEGLGDGDVVAVDGLEVRVVATPGALSELNDEARLDALARHARGDWGDAGPNDWAENELALKDGSRLLSVYHTPDGVKFWIITEADRSSTAILLPSEY